MQIIINVFILLALFYKNVYVQISVLTLSNIALIIYGVNIIDYDIRKTFNEKFNIYFPIWSILLLTLPSIIHVLYVGKTNNVIFINIAFNLLLAITMLLVDKCNKHIKYSVISFTILLFESLLFSEDFLKLVTQSKIRKVLVIMVVIIVLNMVVYIVRKYKSILMKTDKRLNDAFYKYMGW